MIEKSGNNKKENAKRESLKNENSKKQKNERVGSENNKSKFENADIGNMKNYGRGKAKYSKSNSAGIVSKNLSIIGITAAAIVLFAVIMTYMMPNDSGKSGFDENSWRESVTKAEEQLNAVNGSEKSDGAAAVSSSALPKGKENDSLTDLSGDDMENKADQNDIGNSKNNENALTEDTETTESTYGVYTAEEAAAISATEKLIMESPVDGGVLEDYSGENLVYSKTMQDWRTHNGIDFAASEGTEVKAAADGTIEAITENSMLGRTVIIMHDNGIRSIYSNLAEGDEAVVGNNVLCGTVIGKIGNTAAAEVSEAPHLHFEVSVNEETVNPHDYLNIANATLQPLYD